MGDRGFGMNVAAKSAPETYAFKCCKQGVGDGFWIKSGVNFAALLRGLHGSREDFDTLGVALA